MCVYTEDTHVQVMSCAQLCLQLAWGGEAKPLQDRNVLKEEQVPQTLDLSKAQFFLAFVIYCSRN